MVTLLSLYCTKFEFLSKCTNKEPSIFNSMCYEKNYATKRAHTLIKLSSLLLISLSRLFGSICRMWQPWNNFCGAVMRPQVVLMCEGTKTLDSILGSTIYVAVRI